MSITRILRYGILAWLIGLAVTLVEVQFALSRGILTFIFYAVNTVLYLVFLWIYFRRTIGTFSWQTGLEVALGFLIIAVVLDIAVFVLFLGLELGTYFSLHQLLGFIELLALGALVGYLMGEKKKLGQPEGLA